MQQQRKERVVRGEEHSEVRQALGPSFWVGNHCFKESLNTDVRMMSLQGLHRKVTAYTSEGVVLPTLLPSALE